ncbi:Rho GTPase activating protein 22 [Mycena venus]|uniref:Rho GTPase activating protein 22 n=1 Tax=Mycena venus TaxID=2733690 RepID=A0A8H6X7Y0_9AGAR|nr:Rho GTPase activating protein 22 [Mycena venus]
MHTPNRDFWAFSGGLALLLFLDAKNDAKIVLTTATAVPGTSEHHCPRSQLDQASGLLGAPARREFLALRPRETIPRARILSASPWAVQRVIWGVPGSRSILDLSHPSISLSASASSPAAHAKSCLDLRYVPPSPARSQHSNYGGNPVYGNHIYGGGGEGGTGDLHTTSRRAWVHSADDLHAVGMPILPPRAHHVPRKQPRARAGPSPARQHQHFVPRKSLSASTQQPLDGYAPTPLSGSSAACTPSTDKSPTHVSSNGTSMMDSYIGTPFSQPSLKMPPSLSISTVTPSKSSPHAISIPTLATMPIQRMQWEERSLLTPLVFFELLRKMYIQARPQGSVPIVAELLIGQHAAEAPKISWTTNNSTTPSAPSLDSPTDHDILQSPNATDPSVDRDPPDMDCVEPEDLVDNLDTMAAAAFEVVTEEDLFVTSDLLEVQTADCMGCLLNFPPSEENVEIQDMYSYLQDVEPSPLISELALESLYWSLPPGIRSCMRAHVILPKWTISSLVAPGFGLWARQSPSRAGFMRDHDLILGSAVVRTATLSRPSSCRHRWRIRRQHHRFGFYLLLGIDSTLRFVLGEQLSTNTSPYPADFVLRSLWNNPQFSLIKVSL